MKRVAVAISIVCGIASAFLCWNVLGLIPHIPDELSYLYQGRILATGHLSMPPPPVPEAFTVPYDHILRDAKGWRAIYPPGWPLLLAMGWLAFVPWLVNPLLIAVSAFGLYRLAMQLFDERTAIFTLVAFACSPFAILMGAGFMAHPSTLCFSVWCAFFLVRRAPKDFLYGGICGAFAFAIRPYTAAPLLLPLVIWSLAKAGDRRRNALQLTIGALPIVMLFCAYNAIQFGSIFRTGYAYDPDAAFRGSPIEHLKQNLPWYFSALSRSIWAFPWPDLILLFPLLVPHSRWKEDLLLFLCFLSLTIAYSCFYYRDIVYGGPRYVYESVGFLTILAARSIHILENWIERMIHKRIGWLIMLLFVYPLAVTLPAQMSYHRQAYHGQSRELLNRVEEKGIGKSALILVGGDAYVFRTFFLENGPDPAKSQRVYARDLSGQREEILRKYNRDEVWKMHIEMRLLKGVNRYPDRSEIGSVKFDRMK